MKPTPHWRGDPLFLKDVLTLFGVKVEEAPGYKNRGHGDFGAIKGIIVHHTGGNNTPTHIISHHPQLGLCSQIHLLRNGKAILTGVGIAWHAGRGSYPGWPTNAANMVSIGIEANSDGVSPWPAEQLDAYYRICAGILWFLGKRATTDTLLAHWEYSGRAQGKWDPGAGNGRSGAVMDMKVFRDKVNRYIDNPPFKKDLMTDFDKITTRYKSLVPGSSWTGTPIDILLATNLHSFDNWKLTQNLEGLVKNLEKKIEDQNKVIAELTAAIKK